jgi:hypothetical protein
MSADNVNTADTKDRRARSAVDLYVMGNEFARFKESALRFILADWE